MTIPLSAYLILSAYLFVLGVIGVATRRNALIIFMCIELMLNAVNLTFVAFSRFLNSMDGQIFVFFVMAVATAEVGVGLAIILAIMGILAIIAGIVSLADAANSLHFMVGSVHKGHHLIRAAVSFVAGVVLLAGAWFAARGGVNSRR